MPVQFRLLSPLPLVCTARPYQTASRTGTFDSPQTVICPASRCAVRVSPFLPSACLLFRSRLSSPHSFVRPQAARTQHIGQRCPCRQQHEEVDDGFASLCVSLSFQLLLVINRLNRLRHAYRNSHSYFFAYSLKSFVHRSLLRLLYSRSASPHQAHATLSFSEQPPPMSMLARFTAAQSLPSQYQLSFFSPINIAQHRSNVSTVARNLLASSAALSIAFLRMLMLLLFGSGRLLRN